MMNIYKKIGVITVAIALAATSVLAAEGVTELETLQTLESSTPAVTMSSDEDGILLMREEEKLARDVYLALGEMWNIRVFSNIARAEQMHMDAMAYLLDDRGIVDPVANAAPGEFSIEKMQSLYDTLVAQGSESAVAALKVGALIEDLDIADLENLLEGTEDDLTLQAYGYLLAGSENHMRAFVGQIERYGESYEPSYISEDRMNEILSASMGMGGSMGRDTMGRESSSRGGGRGRW